MRGRARAGGRRSPGLRWCEDIVDLFVVVVLCRDGGGREELRRRVREVARVGAVRFA